MSYEAISYTVFKFILISFEIGNLKLQLIPDCTRNWLEQKSKDFATNTRHNQILATKSSNIHKIVLKQYLFRAKDYACNFNLISNSFLYLKIFFVKFS